jgi:regulator of sigma E protease
MIATIVELLVVLGIMVLVHEFGHFAVAKLCGVRVETFAIGFGKKLIGIRRGGTDYQINVLPLGGYVKMSGDTPGEAPSGDPGDFNAHPRWQRMLIALAGPVANFILAVFILTIVAMFHHEIDDYLSGPAINDYTVRDTPAAKAGIGPGDRIVHYVDVDNPDWEAIAMRSLLNMNRNVPFSYVHDGKRVDTTIQVAATEADASSGDIIGLLQHLGVVPRAQNMPVTVVEVVPNMPAAKAGLKPGDQIVSIDGVEVHSVAMLLAYMQDEKGKPAQLAILRNGTPQTLPVTPEQTTSDGTKGYRLGFTFVRPPVHVDRLPLGAAVAESSQENLKSAMMIRDVLKGMAERRVSPKSLQGPIGIGQQVGMAARDSIWTLLRLMAMISINLGIFNLLPIPILDGGMILFLLIESAMRRDINQQLKERVYQVAFVCLVVFAVMVIFNDVTKLPLFSKLKP